MLRLLVSICCVFVLNHLWGQSGAIDGRVMFEGAGLELVTVRLEGGTDQYGQVSDAAGRFSFVEIPAGRYELKASIVGFRPAIQEVQVIGGESVEVELALEEDALELEQVVVTGTRAEVPIYRSPVIVNRISNKIFESTQSLSISEGLSFSPGLRVENNCQNCGFTQLRINGLEGAYSQVLINSRPVFSSLAGVYGLEMIPANMIERVEVVKGGGSVLYGGNAIGGTVNIITRDPVENSFELGFNQAFIDAESPDRTLSFNGSIVNDKLNKGVRVYGFKRHRDWWDANADGFSELTELRNTTLGLDAFWDIDRYNKVKLNINHISEYRRGGNDFDLAPHQSDVAEQLEHRIFGGGISFEHYSKDFRHKLSTYLSLQATNRDSYYGGGGRVLTQEDTLTPGDILAINAYGKSNDLAIVGGLQYTYQVDEALILTVGGEYQWNDVRDEMPGYDRVIDQRVATLGTYAQLEWEVTDRFDLLFGSRLDRVGIDGNYDLAAEVFNNDRNTRVFVPRMTAKYAFTDALNFRLSFAQGYRAPQAFDEDLHIETVGGAARFIRLSRDLSIERSNSYTVSLDYTNASGAVQRNFVFEAFHTELDNPFILTDPVELPSGVSVITKRNGSGAYVQGFNLEANIAVPIGLVIQAGMTAQRSHYVDPEEIWIPDDPDDIRAATKTDRLLRTPDLYGFFAINYAPSDVIELTWSGVYTGPMDVPHVVEVDSEYTVIKRTPSFLENNIKASCSLFMDDSVEIAIYAGVQNIFDAFQEDFDIGPDRDAGYVFGPIRPRTFFAGASFSF